MCTQILNVLAQGTNPYILEGNLQAGRDVHSAVFPTSEFSHQYFVHIKCITCYFLLPDNSLLSNILGQSNRLS